MPAESKSQRRLMGWAEAYKKHQVKSAPAKVKSVANSMSSTQLGHFSHTKERGLPEHVKAAFVSGVLKRAKQLGYTMGVDCVPRRII